MERNITLDYFKLFLSVLVVLIHVQPLVKSHLEMSDFISNGLCRIAVPCFFLMNGYFLADKINNKSFMKRRISKLILLTIVWNIIYIMYIFSIPYSIKDMILIFIMGVYHIWYLSACALAFFIFYFLNKNINIKILVGLSFFIFVLGCIIDLYLKNIDFPMVSNFNLYLSMGLPFIILGNFIFRIQNKLHFASNSLINILLLFSFFVFISEVLYKSYYSALSPFYFSLLFVAPILFIFLLKRSNYRTTLDEFCVGKFSEPIFLLHPLIISLVTPMFATLFINDNIIMIPVVLILTLIFSAGLICINKRIRIFL